MCSQLIGWKRRQDKITCSNKCRSTLQRRRKTNGDWREHVPRSHTGLLKKLDSKKIERIGILYGHHAVIIALDCIHDEIVSYQTSIKDIQAICKHIEKD